MIVESIWNKKRTPLLPTCPTHTTLLPTCPTPRRPHTPPVAPTLLVQVILGEYSEGFVDPVTGNQRRLPLEVSKQVVPAAPCPGSIDSRINRVYNESTETRCTSYHLRTGPPEQQLFAYLHSRTKFGAVHEGPGGDYVQGSFKLSPCPTHYPW